MSRERCPSRTNSRIPCSAIPDRGARLKRRFFHCCRFFFSPKAKAFFQGWSLNAFFRLTLRRKHITRNSRLRIHSNLDRGSRRGRLYQGPRNARRLKACTDSSGNHISSRLPEARKQVLWKIRCRDLKRIRRPLPLFLCAGMKPLSQNQRDLFYFPWPNPFFI